MTSYPESGSNPRQYAEVALETAKRQLAIAAEIVAPDAKNKDPLVVFAEAPGEVRDQDTGLELSEQQETELRASIAELGPSREADKPLSEVGLQQADVIFEAGQPHKMKAEFDMVLEDEAARPARLFVLGSPFRKITAEAERASAERLLGSVPETERDVAEALVNQIPGFRSEVYDLPFGYDIQNGFATSNETTGQFKMLGWVDKTPVILMSVDRENYLDPKTKESKYRNQPQTADVIKIVDMVQRQEDENEHPIAFVTSATYEPSRTVDATVASLSISRPVGIAAYGTKRLAEVRGVDAPEPAALNQLPGELHKLALNTIKLEAALAAQE